MALQHPCALGVVYVPEPDGARVKGRVRLRIRLRFGLKCRLRLRRWFGLGSALSLGLAELWVQA